MPMGHTHHQSRILRTPAHVYNIVRQRSKLSSSSS